MKSFPFDDYSFRVISVEHNWLPSRAEIRHFLEGRGYQLVKALGCDDCYVRDQDLKNIRQYLNVQPWRSGAWIRSSN